MTIDGGAVVAGVVGRPVAQSLSPLIHNRWIAWAGLNAAYVPFSPAPDRFEAFVAAQRGGTLAGLNVTLPFKARALALADTADSAARRAGAANLLLFRPDGAIEARNTDGLGVLGALNADAPDLDPGRARVVILGAGGAARGAIGALIDAGCSAITVVNRTAETAMALAEAFEGRIDAQPADTLPALFREADLVIQATSAGMAGAPCLDLPLHRLTPGAVVFDMVFKPLETEVLRAARGRGLATVDGLSMLIAQARPGFEAFYGSPPPGGDIRAVVEAALGVTVPTP